MKFFFTRPFISLPRHTSLLVFFFGRTFYLLILMCNSDHYHVSEYCRVESLFFELVEH